MTGLLGAGFGGQVIVPDDAGYDAARAVFYGGFDRRPAVIVRPRNVSEVARVITVARDRGMALAVRSGGHSLAGHSMVDDAMVLDLASLRDMEIDTDSRTAWAQTGLTAAEYTAAAGAHGLATGFGDTGAVGIGGLTLGGGAGFLVRKHGLTIDDLIAAEVVTSDGDILHVDIDDHRDLFWAIRGGGGNFGVVTRFLFRLNQVDTVVGGMLMLPATPETVSAFITEAEAAPDELSTVANIMIAPPMPFVSAQHHGELVIIALVCYAGPPGAGVRAVAPFRKLATPVVDMIRPMPYPEIYQLVGDPPRPAHEVSRSLFIDTVDPGTGEAIIEHLRATTAPQAMAQLRVLGGAMARVPADATAFAHRDRRIMTTLVSVYERAAETSAHDEWVTKFAADLRDRDDAVYVNFLGAEDQTRVRDAYPGQTWDRLVAVKNAYDPTNLFRHNHNIPSTSA